MAEAMAEPMARRVAGCRTGSGQPSRQRGVALITVLLVVALVTAAAADMTGRHQLDLRRTGNRLALTQAHQIALGGESWAIALLARDRRGRARDRKTNDIREQQGENTRVDSRDEDWARPLPPIPIEGGQVTGRITDAQGRFNVNDLVTGEQVNAVALARFERLLARAGVDTDVARAVVDWIDADDETGPGGAEDDYYTVLERPYGTANQPLATASELRLVRGIDAAAWRALAPHVTALPAGAAINVNTAGPKVLQAVVPTLDDNAAEQLVTSAGEQPFTAVEDFLAHPLVAEAGGETGIEAEGLAVESQFFRVRTDVQMGSLEYTLYSWLQRNDNGASRVLRRARTPN